MKKVALRVITYSTSLIDLLLLLSCQNANTHNTVKNNPQSEIALLVVDFVR
jgi:hypothetical protein